MTDEPSEVDQIPDQWEGMTDAGGADDEPSSDADAPDEPEETDDTDEEMLDAEPRRFIDPDSVTG